MLRLAPASSAALMTIALVTSALVAAPSARAERVRHDFNLMFHYDDGQGSTSEFTLNLSSIQNVPYVTEFDGEVLANNPLYQELSPIAQNPVYDGAADPGSGGWIAGIAIGVQGLTHLHREGIIHRDLATRNVVVTTGTGDFSIDPDLMGAVLFMSDTPIDADGNETEPVRWMAPEAIVKKQYTRGGPDETLTLLAGSSFEATIIPAPAATLPLLGSVFGLTLAARRRR